MKRISTLALLSLAAVMAAPAAWTQIQLKASVPFAFTAADIALPAGEYSVCSSHNGVVRLVNLDKHVFATVTVAKSYNDPNGKNLLVFAKHGDQYFLRKIVSPVTEKLNVDLPVTGREKRARSGEEILVAAR